MYKNNISLNYLAKMMVFIVGIALPLFFFSTLEAAKGGGGKKPPPPPPPPSMTSNILIPLYVYPTWWNEANYVWDDIAAEGNRISITAIINPYNGPNGGPPNSDYQIGMADLRNGGVSMIGYVYSSYGQRNIDEVKADIDLYDLYFDVEGIFIDEVSTSLDDYFYYEELYNYIKSKANLNSVVLNPGINIPEPFVNISDNIVIFESDSRAWKNYVPDAYVQNYPAERFTALVHNQKRRAAMETDINRAKERNVANVYITDRSGAGAWTDLAGYWTAEVDYIFNTNP